MKVHLARTSFEFATAWRADGRRAFCLMLAGLAASGCGGNVDGGDVESNSTQLDIRQEQRLALSKMDLRVSKYDRFGGIRHIAGETGLSLGTDESLAPLAKTVRKCSSDCSAFCSPKGTRHSCLSTTTGLSPARRRRSSCRAPRARLTHTIRLLVGSERTLLLTLATVASPLLTSVTWVGFRR